MNSPINNQGDPDRPSTTMSSKRTGPPSTMTQRQWNDAAAIILDFYNDGKFDEAKMRLRLKELNKVKIK